MEALQDNINSAVKILNGNGIDNAESIVRQIEEIVSFVQNEVPNDMKRNITDSHIPALAAMYVAIKEPKIETLKDEYDRYGYAPSLASNNMIGSEFNSLMNDVRSKRLFGPSDEKFELFKKFTDYVTDEIHRAQSIKDKIEQSSVKRGEDVVYEDENIEVILGDSRIKCIKYGQPNLCISWTGPNNYYWAYRMGKQRDDGYGMSTYFVTFKNTGDRILIDKLGNDQGDVGEYSYNEILIDGIQSNKDIDITENDLIEKYPELEPAIEQNVFKFIPYAAQEKRFQYIDENINSILSPEIRSYEDYEMFIETGKPIKHNEWYEIPKSIIKDVVVKYMAGKNNFNIPDDMLKYGTPSDRRNYESAHLEFLKKWVASL